MDSIKYLQPGLAGTPKVNGTEMVSQFGTTNTDFGNHYYIYYYWYPDGSQDSAFLGTTISSTNIDLGYKRTYRPGVHLVPVDMEIHYMLGQGNTALYVYLVANHPSSYSSYSNMTISFIQMIWPVAHDSTNFLCENMYCRLRFECAVYVCRANVGHSRFPAGADRHPLLCQDE